MDIEQFGKGLLADTPDKRDFRAEIAMGAVQLPDSFSLRNDVLAIHPNGLKHQGSSSSCVGQSFSYYAEMLHYKMTGVAVQLSSRDIYSHIFLPQGGAYLRNAADFLVVNGCDLETDVSSYMQGNPPTEDFERQNSDITEEDDYRGLDFLAKSYVRIDSADFNMVKQAIFQNNGVVLGAYGDNAGWQTGYVQPPKNRDWSHAFYCIGWKTMQGTEYIEFANSWGNGWGDSGFGWIPRTYFDNDLILNPWTIMDFHPNDYSIIQHKIWLIARTIKDLLAKIGLG